MATIADDLMDEIVARYRSYPLISNISNIRRDHRTMVSKAEAPAVHVVDLQEERQRPKGCDVPVVFSWRTTLLIRSDDGYDAAALLKVKVMAATESLTPDTAYSHNAVIYCTRIVSEQEVADSDVLRVDMHFEFHYRAGLWTL